MTYTPAEIAAMDPATLKNFNLTPAYNAGTLAARGLNEQQIQNIAPLAQQANQALAGIQGFGSGNTGLAVLQDALNQKSNVTNQPLGTSELYQMAGLPSTGAEAFPLLQQGLQQRSSEMAQKYNFFQQKAIEGGSQMQDMLASYKVTQEAFDKTLASAEAAAQEARNWEKQLALTSLQNQLQKEMFKFQSDLKISEPDYQAQLRTTEAQRQLYQAQADMAVIEAQNFGKEPPPNTQAYWDYKAAEAKAKQAQWDYNVAVGRQGWTEEMDAADLALKKAMAEKAQIENKLAGKTELTAQEKAELELIQTKVKQAKLEFNNAAGIIELAGTEGVASDALSVADGSEGGQCGYFVNRYTGLGLGDTFESKIAKMDPSIKTPEPGDVFVMRTSQPAGHAGFIVGVSADGQTVTVKDSNFNPSSKPGIVQTHELPITAIAGLARPSNAGAVLASTAGIMGVGGDYEVGSNPIVDAWVWNITNGKAKISDIKAIDEKNQPGLKNNVQLGIATVAKQSYAPGSDPEAVQWAEELSKPNTKYTLDDVPLKGDSKLRYRVLVELQKTGGAYQNDGLTEMQSEALKLGDELMTMIAQPGFRLAVIGAFSRVTKYLPESDAETFYAKYDGLKSKLELDNVKYLRGQGAVSDRERDILAKATLVLRPGGDPEVFVTELQKVMQTLQEIGQRNVRTIKTYAPQILQSQTEVQSSAQSAIDQYADPYNLQLTNLGINP
jgi:hypothetical protein